MDQENSRIPEGVQPVRVHKRDLRAALIVFVVECGGYDREAVEKGMPLNVAPESASFASELIATDFRSKDEKGDEYRMYVCEYNSTPIGFPMNHSYILSAYYNVNDIPNQTKEEFITARRAFYGLPLDFLKDWCSRNARKRV